MPSALPALNVLVMASADSESILDVQRKLTPFFAEVDTVNSIDRTLSVAELQEYDAILVFNNVAPRNSNELGDNLAAYIEGGGGVVGALFHNSGTETTNNINGDFADEKYQVTSRSSRDILSGTQLINLNSPDYPGHPLLDDVDSFDCGSSRFKLPLTTGLRPGSYGVARFTSGEILIAAKDNVGERGVSRVDLGFYPPSSDVRSDFWVSTTEGDIIMRNALRYVAGVLPNPPPPPPR